MSQREAETIASALQSLSEALDRGFSSYSPHGPGLHFIGEHIYEGAKLIANALYEVASAIRDRNDGAE